MIRTLTQQRAWDDLLAVRQPRPAPDPGWVPDLRARVEQAAARAAGHLDRALTLRINKTALQALDCDGRYLDLWSTPFSWSPRMLLGKLAHRAIELDFAGRRARPVDDVVQRVWMESATDVGSAADFVSGLDGITADDLRAAVRRHLITFRESFPALPSYADIRAEQPYAVRLADGRVELRGVVDLVLGAARADERRVLLVDLKTGHRHARHLHDMRFYALLATLVTGVAPFRAATYYLDEAAWEHEDIAFDHLEAAARTVADKVERAGLLVGAPPPSDELRLEPGPACRWCTRAPQCPASTGDLAAVT